MKKITYTLLCGFLLPMAAKAQKLNIPAPPNSIYVLEYNLPFVFSQTNAEKLNLSEAGVKLYEELFLKNRNFESDFDVIKSGLNHGQKAFMHYVKTDSIAYTMRLLPLQNVAQFKNNLGINSATKSEKATNGTFYQLKYRDHAFISNSNDYAILVSYSDTYNAFDDSARAARWGIEYGNRNDYGYTSDAAVEAVAAVEAYADDFEPEVEEYKDLDVVEEVPAPVEVAVVEAVKDSPKKIEEREKTIEVVPPPPIAPATIVEAAPDNYSDNYELYQSQKDSIFGLWTRDFVSTMIKQNKDSYYHLSALKDLESPRTSAAATFYLNGNAFSLGDVYSLFGIRSMLADTQISKKNEMWSMFQLNFEPNAIKVEMTSRVSDQMAKSSKRIYKRKYNKKFSKYINSATDIGLWTMAVNTKNYLEETPAIVKDAFSLYGIWPDESALIADLFSVVIDEKAIGKLIWGDAAFVFTNIKEKEYKSIKYKWDEETFESSEEEVSKSEALPNFLFMMSTRDAALFTRALNYGAKKGVYEFKNGIYAAKKLTGKYDPFEYFCTIKDGIIFIGTERSEMEMIRDGKSRGNMSTSDKKLMRQNSTSGWFHTKRLVGTFAKNEQDNLKTIKINNMLSNVGVMQFKSAKMKGNKMHADITLQTPNNRTNSLEYLLYLIDDLKDL